MSLREWLAGLAFLEIALILVALRTGWRWHRAGPVRRFFVALRSRWKRVLAFSALGWLFANLLGLAAVLVLYEASGVHGRTDEATETLAIVLPLLGVGLGAFAGYATKKETHG